MTHAHGSAPRRIGTSTRPCLPVVGGFGRGQSKGAGLVRAPPLTECRAGVEPYPFRPAVATLATMYFCKKMYRMSTGTAVITAPAISGPYSNT